jgi:hypothetical protein
MIKSCCRKRNRPLGFLPTNHSLIRSLSPLRLQEKASSRNRSVHPETLYNRHNRRRIPRFYRESSGRGSTKPMHTPEFAYMRKTEELARIPVAKIFTYHETLYRHVRTSFLSLTLEFPNRAGCVECIDLSKAAGVFSIAEDWILNSSSFAFHRGRLVPTGGLDDTR